MPQFDHTHINFQRIPIVDTSNPFNKQRGIPTAEQSLVLIHFLKPKPSVEYKLNLRGLIEGSFISGFNTIIIPGGKMSYAMELILTESILDLMAKRGQLADSHA
jgi:phosphoribulokinase